MLSSETVLMGLTMTTALAACLLICTNAQRIGTRLGVMDEPDGSRKCHPVSTPLVGGLAICAAMIVWIAIRLLTGSALVPSLKLAMLVCGCGMAIVGFTDDQRPLTPLARTLFLVHFLFMAFLLDPHLMASSLNWGGGAMVPIAPWIYVPLVGVSAVGIVNSVNMADGQNGLVASMYVVWFACLAFCDGPTVTALSMVMCLASACVLVFNLTGKLFLGDCGSNGVTFALGVLVASALADGKLAIPTVMVWFFIPVADCIRLLISRPLNGKSPFAGDRDHFHHRLQERLGTRMSYLAYVGVVAGTSLVATFLPQLAWVCLIATSVFFFSFAFRARAAANDDLEQVADPGNVFVLDEHKVRSIAVLLSGTRSQAGE